jgi:hypothetical protein
LGALQYALPALFGNSASLASNGGLLGVAGKGAQKVASYFTDWRDGQRYALGADGKAIGTLDQSGNVVPFYGNNAHVDFSTPQQAAATNAMPWDSGNSWNPAAATTGATTFPMDFGSAADNASYGFNVVNDTANTATDWLSNFMP